jgi:hypothetical protein
MRISACYDRARSNTILVRAQSWRDGAWRLAGVLIVIASFMCCGSQRTATADESAWGLQPVETDFASSSAERGPIDFGLTDPKELGTRSTFSLWRAGHDQHRQTLDPTVAPAGYAQPTTEEAIPRPSYLDVEDQMPRPSFLGSDEADLPITMQIERLNQRIEELETSRLAQQDATRSIIRQSFAERASNITDAVTFGGTLETLTFWQEDFDGIASSDIVLDTAELDFEIQMNTWSRASLVMQFFDGQDFLFQTTEGDEVGVDRFNVRQGFITIGDTTRYPLFVTCGREFAPFGISTGNPVTDVLTIVDPLTVEVFETQEDMLLFGFEGPVPPPPPPVSPYSAPPLPAPRPILFNPAARFLLRSTCGPLCGPLDKPVAVAAPPSNPCIAPYNGAIYFFNGNTTPGLNEEDHIQQMGGTLGYRAKGVAGPGIPWNVNCNVDVISSVFDTNFLQFEYRHYLDQIGFVPGMAAHMRSAFGPFGLILEWNGAINSAEFIDDAGNPIDITPSAWQVALNYQFDWNRDVEVIGAQGTYLAMGYSESNDLAGVTRIFDPLVPVPTRIGFVPERRFSIGIGEWILDGMRIAIEYSHIIDYPEDEGGTGNSANGYFMQWTYEW